MLDHRRLQWLDLSRWVVFSGFWKKTDVYREQPDTHFKHEVLVLLETENMDQTIAWSTDQRFNLLMQDQARIPSIKVSALQL